jgi:hypothetical protein
MWIRQRIGPLMGCLLVMVTSGSAAADTIDDSGL